MRVLDFSVIHQRFPLLGVRPPASRASSSMRSTTLKAAPKISGRKRLHRRVRRSGTNRVRNADRDLDTHARLELDLAWLCSQVHDSRRRHVLVRRDARLNCVALESGDLQELGNLHREGHVTTGAGRARVELVSTRSMCGCTGCPL